MLFSNFQIGIWNLHRGGVLHVGAHLAEESSFYKKNGFGPIIWVEAQEELVSLLKSKARHSGDYVIKAVAWDQTGIKMSLKVTNNSQSSSVLEFGTHKDAYPDVKVVREILVETVRLDEVIPTNSKFSLINLDIQGAELRALIGLGDFINGVEAIICEINKVEVYKGCTVVKELDDWLCARGFKRVASKWTSEDWGDGLYLRTDSRTKIKIAASWLLFKSTLLFDSSTYSNAIKRTFRVFGFGSQASR